MKCFELLLLVGATFFAFSDAKSQTEKICTEHTHGPDCKSPCHCSCGADGKCKVEFACNSPWMGLECEHKNLAYNNHFKIVDGDVNTCTYVNDQIIYHTFGESELIRWLKIQWENEPAGVEIWGFINGIKVREKEPFVSFVHSDVSNIYHGQFETRINMLGIKLDKFVRVCELEVSGGRNVALYRDVSIDGKTNGSKNSDPHFVVDGVSDEKERCLEVEAKANQLPAVTIHFNRSVAIWKWELVSKEVGWYSDDRKCGMKYIKIDAWDDDARVFTSEYSERIDPALYHQFWEPHTVSKIMISLPPKLNNKLAYGCGDKEPVLTICEFRIFGDSICPRGKWGSECDRKCHCSCKNNENCFPSTGYCPHGCTGSNTTPFIGLTVAAVVSWFVLAFD